MPRPLGVAELSKYIQTTLATDPILRSISVEGEVVNAKNARYLYFDLREGNALLSCVQFDRSNGGYIPVDGEQVICKGRINAYSGQSRYQLICTSISPIGRGDALLKREALKKKLWNEGLFDPSKKKLLPQMPQVIGIITSMSGAVIHDFTNELETRFPLATVVTYDAQVQGVNAPTEIRNGIVAMVRRKRRPDVLVIARGGGAFEHLEVFDDESLVRAIAACDIPVVTAIGHQVDDSLADLASDRRASTPTEAAVIVTPSIVDIALRIESLTSYVQTATHASIDRARKRVESLQDVVDAYRPERTMQHMREAVTQRASQIQWYVEQNIGKLSSKLQSLERSIEESFQTLNQPLRLSLFTEEGERIVDENQIQTNARYHLVSDHFDHLIDVQSKRPLDKEGENG